MSILVLSLDQEPQEHLYRGDKMTVSLGLNNNNDIFADQGRIRRVSDGAQISQAVRNRLLMYYGEWFLDTTSGVPYLESVFTRPTDLVVAESIIKSVIVNTPGILSLNEFDMEYNATEDKPVRRLRISFEAESEYGIIENATITL